MSKNCFFVDFAINTECFWGYTPEFSKISVYFGIKTFFFVGGLHLRIRENSQVFEMKTEFVDISVFFEIRTFFLRIRRISGWTLFSFGPHSRIQINKVFVPPQPPPPPQSRYPGAGSEHRRYRYFLSSGSIAITIARYCPPLANTTRLLMLKSYFFKILRVKIYARSHYGFTAVIFAFFLQ